MTVPGAVSAWTELHAKFGKLPFERLFEPAISYGRNGFLVSPTVAEQWAAQVPLFERQPGFAEAFLPGGRAPKPGERFSLPDHAATLEAIATTRGEAFYRGALAAKLEAHASAHGGVMRAATSRLTAPTGWARSTAATADTPCTRFRPTGRGSSR